MRNQWWWKQWVVLAAAGAIANADPALADAVQYTLAGGQSQQLQIAASALQPRLLLVEQRGVDVLIDCGEGGIRNAPTGRLGYEAVVLDAPAQCVVRPKMARARAGQVRVSEHPLDAGVLGIGPGQWRLFASLLSLDDQVQLARKAAMAGYAALLAQPGADPQLRLSWLFGNAELARRARAAATAQYQLALQLAEAGGFDAWQPALRNAAGMAELDARRFAEADTAFAAARTWALRQRNGYEAAAAINNSCLVLHYQGQLIEATRCYRRAVDGFATAGEVEHRAVALVNLASAEQQLGSPDSVLDALNEALAIRLDGPNERSLGNVYLQLVQAHTRLADWNQALAYSQRAVDVFERLGEPGDLSRGYRARAGALRALGQSERARFYAERAVASAQQQPDLQIHAAALAESATLSIADSAASLAFRDRARDAFRAAQAEPAAQREDILAIEPLLRLGRLEDARLRQQANAAVARSERLNLRALYSLTQARIALASGDFAAALALSATAAEQHAGSRDVLGQLDSARLGLESALRAGSTARARALLDQAIAIRQEAIRDLPSPAQAHAVSERTAQLRTLLLQTYQLEPAAFTADALWSALAGLDQMPQWSARREVDPRWREYRYKLSRLADGQWSSAAERERMLAAVERLESQLELQFTQHLPVTQGRLRQVQQALPADAAILRISTGTAWHLGLWVGPERTDVLQWPVAGRSLAPAMETLQLRSGLAGPGLRRLYLLASGDPGSPSLLPRADPPDAAHATELIVLRLAEEPDAAVLRLASLPIDFRVATLQMTTAQPLPGAEREKRWLQERLGGRLRLLDVRKRSAAGRMLIPTADVLHIAAHGWSFARHPLAQALSGDAPEQISDRSETVSVTDLQFTRPPSLIVLNACDAAGGDAGQRVSLAQQLATTTGAIVIAPIAPVDDGQAFVFSRALFEALEEADVASAFAAANLAWRDVANPADANVWQMIVGNPDHRSAQTGDFVSSAQ